MFLYNIVKKYTKFEKPWCFAGVLMQNVYLTLKIGLFIMNLYKRDTSNGIIRVTGRKYDYRFLTRIFMFLG